jgi:two-component system, OmpR family, copper resistance phosphate regulon response regulator CusR|uniref:response regulator transcription factor n=1 Tax=Gelidibacter sp. TaxID=2018083 RepID=UPI00404A3A25
MKILIVEDEPGIYNFLRQGLEEEGYYVSISENGTEALKLALSGDFDILLLDWMIPGLSGIEVCRRFKKEFPDTPVILLTAKDTVDDTIFGLQSGANDYIKKPFHFAELLERIKVQLRPKSGEHSQFVLGNITLNTANHQVLKENVEIQLTQKEFALLEYLMRHKGNVCTRTRIIENVWDIHFEYDTGVIDVYINALRKKLKLSDDENYIQTIRGIGYIAKEL